MGIRDSRVVPQLAQNVIKRLGRYVAWRHAILFALGVVKAIGEGGIARQKNLPKNILDKVFEA
jgi:hypothetical protein